MLGPHIAIWCICAAGLGGVLLRPRGTAEWVWAGGAAAVLVVLQLLAPAAALAAVLRGDDVYLFLTGMMALAEIARREGVFDWIAAHATSAAGGSPRRLLALVYAAGVAVTVVLSNDATAVVLTPAVAAAVRRAGCAPRPHLLACAFVANAASFVLPISNPANLVVFDGALPALGPWLRAFALPSLAAIGATYAALAFAERHDLDETSGTPPAPEPLAAGGRIALAGIAGAAVVLVVASAAGLPLGAVTLGAAAVVLGAIALRDGRAPLAVARHISWGVLVLVAGLFVMVAALDATGALALGRHAASVAAGWPHPGGAFALACGAALLSNLTNNLPAGLAAGDAVAHAHGYAALHEATAIGIDLGPNLSVTGSLATVLWLVALRREGIVISALAFLRIGAVVMPPALLLAVAALTLVAR